MHNDDVLIALSTVPDAACAERISNTLVIEGLAACISRVPGLLSTYRWQGTIHEDAEVLLVIKTTRGRLPVLQDRLKSMHPYELPELVAVEVAAGSVDYLGWIRAVCSEHVEAGG